MIYRINTADSSDFCFGIGLSKSKKSPDGYFCFASTTHTRLAVEVASSQKKEDLLGSLFILFSFFIFRLFFIISCSLGHLLQLSLLAIYPFLLSVSKQPLISFLYLPQLELGIDAALRFNHVGPNQQAQLLSFSILISNTSSPAHSLPKPSPNTTSHYLLSSCSFTIT